MLNRKFSHILAATALAALPLLGLATPASAATQYYPSGPQVNVPVSSVTGGGWTLCWSEAYGESSQISDIVAGTDNHSARACDGSHILMTGWATATPGTLITLAAAPRAEAMAVTEVEVPHLVNGSWWAFTPQQSWNVSPVFAMRQFPGDQYWDDGTDARRISWHMFSSSTNLDGGWSLGTNNGLNESTEFVRALYTATPEAAPELASTGTDSSAMLRSGLGAASLAILGAAVVAIARRRKNS